MKWDKFFKDFLTSKKYVVQDILLYAFWGTIGLIVISYLWTITRSFFIGFWGIDVYLSSIITLVYQVFAARVVYEVLNALFDIRESIVKEKKSKKK